MSATQRVATGVSGAAFFWNALLFTRALRARGITTDLGAAIDYSRALTMIDIGDREQEIVEPGERFGLRGEGHEGDGRGPSLPQPLGVAPLGDRPERRAVGKRDLAGHVGAEGKVVVDGARILDHLEVQRGRLPRPETLPG